MCPGYDGLFGNELKEESELNILVELSHWTVGWEMADLTPTEMLDYTTIKTSFELWILGFFL